MFLRIHLIIVLVCVGIGTAPQFVQGESPYRIAQAYAAQHDVERAAFYYGLALKNAAPKQVAPIAYDYAAFLLEIGNLQRAELILRQALTQSPHDEELIRTLARCLVRQDKVMEGLRYFKSIYSEAEAREEIAKIYREQGNTDMLVAVESKWGGARSEPALVATVSRPAQSAEAAPTVSVPTAVVPRPLVAAAKPAVAPTRPEMFDSRIPIPVPRLAPLPPVASAPKSTPALPAPQQAAARLPRPAPLPAVAATLPAPLPEKRTVVLENPVKLAVAPLPVLSEASPPPKMAAALQPRRHYVVNATTAADIDALFPVKPAVAMVPVQ